jgi:predicted ATPase
MISSLRIINFKSLADTGLLNLRPLTFLVGPNSSGKSSIIQSLLLLRQTVQSRDVKNPLNINGPYVQLGSYPDLLYLHDYKAPLHFEFSFGSGTQLLQPVKLPHIDQPVRRIDQVTFQVTFGYNKKTMQVYLKGYSSKLLPGELTFEVERRAQGKYYATVRSAQSPTQDAASFPLSTIEKFYYANPFGRKTSSELGTSLFHLAYFLRGAIEELFSSVFYIGPLREWPKRTYIATGEAPQDVGLKGELSIDVLWVGSRSKRTRERLLGKVNHWMRAFGISSEVELQRLRGNNYSVILKDPHTSLSVNLADVGFGASQILPIVIEGFYARSRATLLIEQPEIHLHPRAQATLGDLLIDIVKTGGDKNLIVETHSEHVLARIRRRIAEGSFRKDDIAIYYCEPSKNGTKIAPIRINDLGQFEGEGLPAGFFEEGYEEAAEQFKALAQPTS